MQKLAEDPIYKIAPRDVGSVQLSVASWAKKKLREQKIATFQQTAATFQQRRLWVLKIAILPLTSPKMGNFQNQLH